VEFFRKLMHREITDDQKARLYPGDQPKVFSRLWEEVGKRKYKQEKLKRLSDKRRAQNWLKKV
jgi:hypothetical protein